MKHKQCMVSWQETVYWIIYEFICFVLSSTYIYEAHQATGRMAQGSAGVFERARWEGAVPVVYGSLSSVPSSSIQVGLIVAVVVILKKWIWKEQASSQCSIFFGGSPKQKSVFLVHFLLVMHTATWWHYWNNYPDLSVPGEPSTWAASPFTSANFTSLDGILWRETIPRVSVPFNEISFCLN